MNKNVVIAFLLLSLCCLTACNTGRSGGAALLTPEQERLLHINMIDSLTLPSLLNLDSIEGSDKLESISAEAWMLIDDNTGFVISQRYANEPAFMASLTKMMTCLLALENGNMTDTVKITEDVFVAKDSRVRLGDGYVMSHLIDEMMLVSDNDAAYALAKHIGGDTLTFCEMMNEKAAYLGMTNTHFANPNGMPNFENYSSACDLVRLSRYCMRDSSFAQIVGTKEKDIPLTDGRHMPCRNTNVLLTTYDGCIGIKTGFTRQAGNCLASAATRNGVTLYLVLLNSRSMSSRFTESAILLDYGFNVMKAYYNN
jgi:D-alanyl-D-alanine carboxypeptidase